MNKLFSHFSNGSVISPKQIAEHTDINDEAQTVTVDGETPPPMRTPPPAPRSPQTGRDGLPVWLLVVAMCAVTAAAILTVYTRKRWKRDISE